MFAVSQSAGMEEMSVDLRRKCLRSSVGGLEYVEGYYCRS
jgi:hypothetical protein